MTQKIARRRSFLNEETESRQDAAARIGVQYEISVGGKAYTFSRKLSNGKFEYEKAGEGSIYKRASEVNLPTSPTVSGTTDSDTGAKSPPTGSKGPSTIAPTDGHGFRLLNATIAALKDRIGIGSTSEKFSYSGASVSGGANITKDFKPNSDVMTAANLGMLVLVCRSLAKKFNEPSTVTDFARLAKAKFNQLFGSEPTIELSKVFKADDWNKLIDALVANDETTGQIIDDLNTYLGKFEAKELPFPNRTGPDAFAKYLQIMAAGTGNDVNVSVSASSGESDGSSGSGSGEVKGAKKDGRGSSSETPAASETGTEKPLQNFLAKHIDKIWVKIQADNLEPAAGNEKEKFKAKITAGGIGPATAKALRAFAVETKERNQDILTFEGTPDVDQALGALTTYTAEQTKAWPGIPGLFQAGEAGLVDFLKYVWSATGGDDYESISSAANEIGVNAPDTFFSTDPVWRALCITGAVSPFPFMVVYGPSAGEIPEGSVLTIEPGGSGPVPRTVEEAVEQSRIEPITFSKKYPSGVVICLGREEGDSGNIPGWTIKPDIWGPSAKRVVDSLGQSTKFTLHLGSDKGPAYVIQANLTFGMAVDFKRVAAPAGAPGAPGAGAPGAAPAPDARTLAGEISQRNTTRGRSDAGEVGPFKLTSVYQKTDGTLGTVQPSVSLKKQTGPLQGGDIFEMSVTNPSDFILVPVLLSRAPLQETIGDRLRRNRLLREQAESGSAHWLIDYVARAQKAAAAPTGKSGKNVGFLPVKSIRWKLDDYYLTYGPGGMNIVEATATMADQKDLNLPDDVNIVTPEQAQLFGKETGGNDAITTALVDYIGSDNNPLGTPLYLSRSLNTRLNDVMTFSRKVSRVV
jgi:hypothetical protein